MFHACQSFDKWNKCNDTLLSRIRKYNVFESAAPVRIIRISCKLDLYFLPEKANCTISVGKVYIRVQRSPFSRPANRSTYAATSFNDLIARSLRYHRKYPVFYTQKKNFFHRSSSFHISFP